MYNIFLGIELMTVYEHVCVLMCAELVLVVGGGHLFLLAIGNPWESFSGWRILAPIHQLNSMFERNSTMSCICSITSITAYIKYMYNVIILFLPPSSFKHTGSENETKVNLKLFLNWFTLLPQDDLQQALNFQITKIDITSGQ